MIAISAPPVAQIRCDNCNRRLADVDNQIITGKILVAIRCERCARIHKERIDAVSG